MISWCDINPRVRLKMVRSKKIISAICLIYCCYLFFNGQIALSQTNIQGVPGYTTVTNPPGSTAYNINSNRVINNGAAILNRYTNFNLATGNTANIYLGIPGGVASTAINIVNSLAGQQTIINGTLRLIAGHNAGDPVGGNLIFIDPNGIMVGQNGSINAGSILLSTSSQTYARLSGGSEINLNNPAQDYLLDTQTININGQYRFNSIIGLVRIDGTLDTLHGVPAPGTSPGVSVFANNVNLSNTGRIFTDEGANVNLVTGNDINYNPSNNAVDLQTTLANDGRVDITGNISSPGGNILASANTEDVAGNIVNMNGFIDAHSMTPGANGGVVVLESPNFTAGAGTPGVSINNGRIETNGDVLIQSPNNVNINNSNTLISAGGDLTIEGGKGVYLAGSYYSDNGNIHINNTGGNNLLIDSNLYATSGNINIDSNGYTILGLSQTFQAPPPAPVFQAYGNVDINGNPVNSYARITSQHGDVTVNSTCAAEFYRPGSVFASNNISVTGNTVIVNQPFNARNGDMTLQSNTGDFLLGQDGLLSSLYGTTYIQRGNTSGSFNTEFYGEISAENTNPGLVFRNNTSGNPNEDDIFIEGTTFGPYGGAYSNTGTTYVDQSFTQGLFVNSFEVIIGYDQPVPPQPPTPPTPPRKPKNPNRLADNPNSLADNTNQDEEIQAYDFTQSYQITAINNTYNSQLYDPTRNSVDYMPGTTHQLTYNEGLPSSDSPVVYDQDDIVGGNNNAMSSQYEYEWYKIYAEENNYTLDDFLSGNIPSNVPAPMTREEAWEAEKQVWNEVWDSEHELHKYQEDYKNNSGKTEIYDNAKNEYAKAWDDYVHYNIDTPSRNATEARRWLETAEERHRKGEFSDRQLQNAKDDYEKAQKEYEKAQEEHFAKLRKANQLCDEMESLEKYSKNSVNNAKMYIDFYTRKLEELKAKKEEADKNYDRAVKASEAAGTGQEISIGSDGNITVGGEAIDLENIKYDRSSLRSSSGTGYQSLNPRSSLGAQGRTPDFSGLEQGSGFSEEAIIDILDQPLEIEYSGW